MPLSVIRESAAKTPSLNTIVVTNTSLFFRPVQQQTLSPLRHRIRPCDAQAWSKSSDGLPSHTTTGHSSYGLLTHFLRQNYLQQGHVNYRRAFFLLGQIYPGFLFLKSC